MFYQYNNFQYLYRFLCVAVFIFASTSPAYAERVYLDITATDVRKVVVAVPSFMSTPSTQMPLDKGRAISSLLSDGLEFHGFLNVVDPKKYGDRREYDWKDIGVDYVILGKFDLKGSGLMVEGRILDVEENKILGGRRYKGSVNQQDNMVLRLCDALIEEFTGEPGIARSKIAYVSDTSGRKELYVSDVLGKNIRQVTRHRHLVVSPRFSPDGRYLSYSSYHTGNQNLYVTDLNQSKVTRAISRRKGMNMAPAWRPDGKTMAVTLSKNGSPDLYLMDREGKILEQLTSRSGINVSPTWSPDGKKMAFVSDRSGTPQIYIMNMNSRNVQRITFEGNENAEPSWSPKGDLIAYTSLIKGRYHAFTIDPANPNSRQQVTSGWGNFESPSWSPDGKQIVLSRKRDGKQAICAVFKTGKGMRVLFKLKGNQSYPQWSARISN